MGFEFAPKPEIEICGVRYECDSTNNDLLKGVSKDFPKIMEVSTQLAKMLECPDNTAQNAEEALRLSEELSTHSRKFIVGCLGDLEYQQIFAGRQSNTCEQVNLAVYLYEFITRGRHAYLDEFRAAVEEGMTQNAACNTPQHDSGENGTNTLPVVDEARGPCARLLAFLRRKG